ncbi:MAG: hypothetical protein ABSG36_15540, partial [Acidimicrobiales bacterium]
PACRHTRQLRSSTSTRTARLSGSASQRFYLESSLASFLELVQPVAIPKVRSHEQPSHSRFQCSTVSS